MITVAGGILLALFVVVVVVPLLFAAMVAIGGALGALIAAPVAAAYVLWEAMRKRPRHVALLLVAGTLLALLFALIPSGDRPRTHYAPYLAPSMIEMCAATPEHCDGAYVQPEGNQP